MTAPMEAVAAAEAHVAITVTGVERADYLLALGRLLGAGVNAEHAVASAAGRNASAQLARAARSAASDLSRGRPVGDALTGAGLLDERESAILSSVAATGEPGLWLERIGNDLRETHERQRLLRAGMIMPAMVLVAAVMISPLAALLTGALAPVDYLMHTLGSLAVIALLIVALRRIWTLPDQGRESALVKARDRLVLRIPVLGAAVARRDIARWCRATSLMLSAGIAADRAVALANAAVINTTVAGSFAGLDRRLAGGETLAASLSGNPWLAGPVHELIATGEEAGRVAEALMRIADYEQSRVQRFDAELVRWSPRLVYMLVMVWLAAGLITGAGVFSSGMD